MNEKKLENQKRPKRAANTRRTRALIAATTLSFNLTSCNEGILQKTKKK